MSELGKNEKENLRKILTPDEKFGGGGLPEDIINAVSFLFLELNMYEDDFVTEAEMREKLKAAETFEDYYKGRAKRNNEVLERSGGELFDEDLSVIAQREAIKDQQLIDDFNEKILRLRGFADQKIINVEDIKKTFEEIRLLIYGKGSKM